MIRNAKFTTAEDLRQFVNLAWQCPSDVGVHTYDNKTADAKSLLGLMALDFEEPVKIVTEDESFYKNIDKWLIS